MNKPIRVRFAPSPTGFMHLGNVRAALINYLFARQNQGTFIIRIEDTDAERNFDPRAQQILADLGWLGLDYNEGPIIGGPHAPYYQSERAKIYQDYLILLQEKQALYHCFCTSEELEKKRERQLALKLPPRYDRTCLRLSPAEVEEKLRAQLPFIWRFKLPADVLTIQDLARGTVTYDLQHFSDTPLTRQDGSFTFIFANFVDDHAMGITHVLRGEDHLSNTAIQAALYKTFNAPLPLFWHLPIMINAEGKKLSKRDFGFSLNDLREAGYLPEAIVNYLALIGGGSMAEEILSKEQLIAQVNFKSMATTGHIRYDLEKLRWINHKWITQLTPHELADRCGKYIKQAYGDQAITASRLTELLTPLQSDLVTLKDSIEVLKYYFTKPEVTREELQAYSPASYKLLLAELIRTKPADFGEALHRECKAAQLPVKDAYALVRLALTGKPHGPRIKDLTESLGTEETLQRLEKLVAII